MNTTMNSDSNGNNGRLNINRTLGNGSGKSNGGYRAGGLTSHDKPTDGDSQHTLTDGEIPGFAYWLRSKELELYRRLARVAANASQGLDVARQIGFNIFTGVWGVFEQSYLGQIEGMKQELARLQFDRDAIQHDLSQTPRSIPVEPAPARLPSGICGVGWFALWALILLVCVGEGQNVSNRVYLLTQNWITSWLGGGILVMAMAVALHAAVHSLTGRLQTACRRIIPVLGLIAFVAWAYCFAQNYADGSGQRHDANGLPALPDDRLLLCLQIVCGCLAVVGLMDGARALQLHPLVLQLNPNWEILNGRAQELGQISGEANRQLGAVQGRLTEYRSCRESFVAVGLADYQAAVELTRIYQERLKQLGDSSDN